MTQHALLNNVEHKDLRVITRRGAAFGDAVPYAVTFPSEFRNIQAHYPIVFQKSADGRTFQPVALLGFQPGQNVFLKGERWDAPYIPLTIDRQPFLIGKDGDELMVHVDLAHPRVSRTDGEPVFLPFGGHSEFLERASSMLLAIHEGLQHNAAFTAVLLELELLEPFALDIEQPDGSQQRFSGYYTIHEERLQQLDGAALERLHRAGHLFAVYMAVASLSRLRDLIDRVGSAAV